jgi:hypothetical protein
MGIHPITPPRFGQSVAFPAFSIKGKTITVIEEDGVSRQVSDPEEVVSYVIRGFFKQWSNREETYHTPYYDPETRELVGQNLGMTVKIPVTADEAHLDWGKLIFWFEQETIGIWDPINKDFDFGKIFR